MKKASTIQIGIKINGVNHKVHFHDLGDEHPLKKEKNGSGHHRWRAEIVRTIGADHENFATGIDELSAANALAEKVKGEIVK